MAATGGKLGDWAAGKTKGAAKDAWSKEGGLKDKTAARGLPTSLGSTSSMFGERKRLEARGNAQARMQKAAEGSGNAASRLLSQMDGGKDHSLKLATGGTLTPDEQSEHNKHIAKQQQIAKYMKTLKTPEAQGQFVSGLAKSGNRAAVETARASLTGPNADATWDTIARNNYDSFEGMPDLRNNSTDAVAKASEFQSKQTAAGYTKLSAPSKDEFFMRSTFDRTTNSVVKTVDPSKLTRMSAPQLESILQDKGARASTPETIRAALLAHAQTNPADPHSAAILRQIDSTTGAWK